MIDGDEEVTWEFETDPVVEEVGVKSELPAHIESFVHDHGLSERTGMATDLVNVANVGKAHGDRRYSEWTLGAGDEIYLLGHVHAKEGATTQLHPENAIVSPADGETFFISDLSDDELIHKSGTRYRLAFGGGALAIVLGAGMIVAGATPLL